MSGTPDRADLSPHPYLVGDRTDPWVIEAIQAAQKIDQGSDVPAFAYLFQRVQQLTLRSFGAVPALP